MDSLMIVKETFSCSVCSLNFPNALELRDHLIEELSIQPELEIFLDIDLGIDSFSEPSTPGTAESSDSGCELLCPKCNRVCKGYKGLKQHMAKAHQKRKKPVVCEECKKTFKHKHALKFHDRQVHQKATRVQCEDCGKEVYNKYILEKHKLTCLRRLN